MLKQRLAPLPGACERLGLSQRSVFGANQLLWLALWLGGGMRAAAVPAYSTPLFALLSLAIERSENARTRRAA